MMQYTDRHYRYMMRLLSRRTLLYTEMVVGTTITHNLGEPLLDRILGFEEIEHPIAVQLGGDDPETLKVAAKVCEDFGYDEINLNVGCPSDRVQKGRFGVCLMTEPERVAQIMEAMASAVKIPVTVKHRIGVDDQDDYEFTARFIEEVSKSGVDLFAVHARKAWLNGLSPAQNRNIPPLKYDFVYRLKQDYPHLNIIINGGVMNLEESETHLQHVDGVMIGRAAYSQPEMFATADERIFGDQPKAPPQPIDLLEHMDAYMHRQLEHGGRISFIAKHLVGLFKNKPGSRRWRQAISKLIQDNPKSFSLPQLYRDVVG